MAKKMTLNPKTVASLKAAPAGQRIEIADVHTPGLRLRVTDTGNKSFVLLGRFGGAKNPTRRIIGEVGKITLADARDIARDWQVQMKGGVDPSAARKAKEQEEQAKKREEDQKRHEIDWLTETKVEQVVETYLREYMYGRGLRSADAVARRLRNEVVKVWGLRPIHSIQREDVRKLVTRIAARPAPHAARNVLDDLRMMFNWCVEIVSEMEPWHLESSPVDRIKPVMLIGKRAVRSRVLNNGELRALWSACDTVGYPWGPMTKLLLLTGARLHEISDAKWSEFDLDERVLTVPAVRFKSGSDHRVQLSAAAVAILSELPRFKNGDHLFSFSHGREPVNSFSRAKAVLDALMGKGVPAWVMHDLRRTVRTRLAGLGVETTVAERVIGHGPKDALVRVYDQYGYVSEIRHALEKWAAALHEIVTPLPPASGDNIVAFGKKPAAA